VPCSRINPSGKRLRPSTNRLVNRMHFCRALSMLKENAPTYMDSKPLFPRISCFPLSPDSKPTVKRQGFPCAATDQLNVIFHDIGTPSEEEYSLARLLSISRASLIEGGRSWNSCILPLGSKLLICLIKCQFLILS
jgi:hypothetical protein